MQGQQPEQALAYAEQALMTCKQHLPESRRQQAMLAEALCYRGVLLSKCGKVLTAWSSLKKQAQLPIGWGLYSAPCMDLQTNRLQHTCLHASAAHK